MRKGFTLIELIIAIFILAIGITAILVMFPLGIQIADSSKMATIASQLGQEKIEEIIAASYGEILCSGGVSPTCADTEDYSEISGFSAFKRITEITCIDGSSFTEVANCSPDSGLKKIKVTVFWRSALKITKKSIELVTLISKK